MTGSPRATRDITFDPPLPEAKRKILDHLEMGTVHKMFMVYETHWWRDAGYSGLVWSGVDGPVGEESPMFQVCMDNQPLGTDNPVGVVMCICGGTCAHKIQKMSESQRKDVMMTYLVDKWGDQAKNAIHYVDYNWNKEQYSGGGSSWIV